MREGNQRRRRHWCISHTAAEPQCIGCAGVQRQCESIVRQCPGVCRTASAAIETLNCNRRADYGIACATVVVEDGNVTYTGNGGVVGPAA